MTHQVFELHQLLKEISPPESGTQSRVISDNADVKVVLFAFSAGGGLPEHTAQVPVIIQILKGTADITIGDERISSQPGTWIQITADTPHSIQAETAVVMLLTLMK